MSTSVSPLVQCPAGCHDVDVRETDGEPFVEEQVR